MTAKRAKSKHRTPERPIPRPDHPADTPTIEDLFDTADGLARTVRIALDQRGTVTRGEVRRALEAYEHVIRASEREVNTT